MALQCLRLLEKTLVATISRTNQGVLTVRSHLRSFPNQAAMPRVAPDQEVVADLSNEENEEKNEIMNNVNKQVKEDKHGRLFAVVQLCGKQFKVTNEDLIIVEGYWDPQAGDKIKMEKVLLVGSSDFTLVGRPILPSSLVHVEGTVIEKSLSSIRTHFKKTPRKQFQRINFNRVPQTFVRINTVEIRREVNEKVDVEGIEGRIF